MSFLETILLPKNAEVPHSVTFYKIIHEDTDIIGKKVKVYSTYGMPFISTVNDCRLYDDVIVLSLDDDLNANSIENTIVEVDEIDRKLDIGYFAEDSLVQLLRHNSKLSKRIPQVIKDRPSFKRKIELAKTHLNIKSVNSTARRTGIVDIRSLAEREGRSPGLSDDNLETIHKFVGNKIFPLGLNSARMRKTMRPPPLPPPPPPPDSTCTGSSCSVSGGRRRTRRFKK